MAWDSNISYCSCSDRFVVHGTGRKNHQLHEVASAAMENLGWLVWIVGMHFRVLCHRVHLPERRFWRWVEPQRIPPLQARRRTSDARETTNSSSLPLWHSCALCLWNTYINIIRSSLVDTDTRCFSWYYVDSVRVLYHEDNNLSCHKKKHYRGAPMALYLKLSVVESSKDQFTHKYDLEAWVRRRRDLHSYPRRWRAERRYDRQEIIFYNDRSRWFILAAHI